MKHNIIACALACATVFSSAWAADGTVNFTGEILDEACKVNIGANNTMAVDLGKVSKGAFSGKDSEASVTKFTIKLKDCPAAVTSAKVKFDGKPDGVDTSLLAIAPVTGAATGVAIKLMTADKAALGLHQVNDYAYTLKSREENKLDFYAGYKATAATVTAGPANSVANFTVNYN